MKVKETRTDLQLKALLTDGQRYLETINTEASLIILIFLGLKKQEEDKLKNELRQAELKKQAIETGSSMGVLAATSSRVSDTNSYKTPLSERDDDAEAMLEFRDNFQRFKQEQENEAKDRIMAAMLGDTERYREMVRKQNFEISEMAKNDLVDVHSQSLPAGVSVHSMASGDDDMPELEPIDGADEESQEEDGGDLMNRIGLVGDFNPDNIMNNQDIKSTGLMFQLYVRGLLEDEMMELVEVEHTRNSVFTGKASKQLHSLLLEPNSQVIPLWVQRSTTYLKLPTLYCKQRATSTPPSSVGAWRH